MFIDEPSEDYTTRSMDDVVSRLDGLMRLIEAQNELIREQSQALKVQKVQLNEQLQMMRRSSMAVSRDSEVNPKYLRDRTRKRRMIKSQYMLDKAPDSELFNKNKASARDGRILRNLDNILIFVVSFMITLSVLGMSEDGSLIAALRAGKKPKIGLSREELSRGELANSLLCWLFMAALGVFSARWLVWPRPHNVEVKRRS